MALSDAEYSMAVMTTFPLSLVVILSSVPFPINIDILDFFQNCSYTAFALSLRGTSNMSRTELSSVMSQDYLDFYYTSLAIPLLGSGLGPQSQLFQSNLNIDADTILSYNKKTINSKDSVQQGVRANVPFPCDCIDGKFLGHVFDYTVQSGDTYEKVAQTWYANLTTYELLRQDNSYDPNMIPDENAKMNVTVTCSCGNSLVSKKYGLFITYPLRLADTADAIASVTGLSVPLLRSYNPGIYFTQGSGVVYFPGKDQNDTYPPLVSSTTGLAFFHSWFYRLAVRVIAGTAMGGVASVLLLAACIYFGCYRKMKVEALLLSSAPEGASAQHERDDTLSMNVIVDFIERVFTGVGALIFLQNGHRRTKNRHAESTGPSGGPASGHIGITVHISVEFSYEELATATNDFSMASKIGEGGFGAVYYAELRGKKAAIKKMAMQASKEFIAELKVLTSVHHLNLVCLIGYCVQGSLFLVYEYFENGNLNENLRGSSGRDPLPWSTRVQIALDSARGLEYIHEHTIPVYIHRDIKSANILIDKNFHAKVADFGLTKLSKVGGVSLPTRVMGTFGYIPPEYARYGDISPKVDVYAFGVVLYELISAKEAVLKAYDSTSESKSLVALFEDVFNQPDPRDDLRKVVDPRLGDDYPLDSVWTVAQLANACTQKDTQLRPSMRCIVVALIILSSTAEDLEVGSVYENQALVNLMFRKTQTYGETNYLDEKTGFWTEPRYCRVLGLKPMGKPTTWMRKLGFGQNQGIVWFSDSNLWGNQPLR
uniref:non-specific serine/threonine protein kinase n=1 Tax=Quercus lobata TaxID=97700 RepID=A0A7N2R930_QUELO